MMTVQNAGHSDSVLQVSEYLSAVCIYMYLFDSAKNKHRRFDLKLVDAT